MAQAVMKVMAQPNSNILYSLVSFSNSTVYDGMVQERPGTARMTEHATSTSDTHPVELKYRGMEAAGGAAAWYPPSPLGSVFRTPLAHVVARARRPLGGTYALQKTGGPVT